jgi:hypothetical protein
VRGEVGEAGGGGGTWRDDRFVIVGHGYDAWMQVSIERLALERVAPG